MEYENLESDFEIMNKLLNSGMNAIIIQLNKAQNKRVVKLPSLTIPVFSGDVKKFSNFLQLFNTLVHENDDISLSFSPRAHKSRAGQQHGKIAT